MQILTLWMVGQSQQTDTRGTDSRSKHCDAARVSAKVTDVLTDPTERLDLIEEAIVPFRCLVTSAEEAWKAQTDHRTAEVEIYTMYVIALI